MRLALALLVSLFAATVATPAFAADDKAKSPPGSTVEMPYLIAPVVVDDHLVAYAYISCKIITASPAVAIEVRNRLAFIQDAFVRDVNAKPIGKADDPATVDTVALQQRMLADTKRVIGAAKIKQLEFITVQMAPMGKGS